MVTLSNITLVEFTLYTIALHLLLCKLKHYLVASYLHIVMCNFNTVVKYFDYCLL